MPDDIDMDSRRRLDEFAGRLDAKVEVFNKQGVLHAAEREAAADWKLQHIRRVEERRLINDLAVDAEIIKLTLERWLARIDKASNA